MAGGGIGGMVNQAATAGGSGSTPTQNQGMMQPSNGGMGGQQQQSYGTGMENARREVSGFGNPYAGPMGGYGGQMGNPYAGQMGGYGPQMGYGGGFGGGYGPQMGFGGYGGPMGGFGGYGGFMGNPYAGQQGQFQGLQNMLNPGASQQQQFQRPPSPPAWQQSDEWKGYQTQMSDLESQLNQSPIMQQLQQLQGKMQGYQQQQQQQAASSAAQTGQPSFAMPAVMPAAGGYGMGQGIAGLFGGMGRGMGGQQQQSYGTGMEMRKGHGGTYFVPKGTPYNPGMG